MEPLRRRLVFKLPQTIPYSPDTVRRIHRETVEEGFLLVRFRNTDVGPAVITGDQNLEGTGHPADSELVDPALIAAGKPTSSACPWRQGRSISGRYFVSSGSFISLG